MSFVWNHDEHVHTLLEEIYDVLKSIRTHQLQITNTQCESFKKTIDILANMIAKQSKMIKEIKINSILNQSRYETILGILAEQQRQTIEFLQKQVKESFINIS
jgi:hypothetical protein